jgi:hypothetical protein
MRFPSRRQASACCCISLTFSMMRMIGSFLSASQERQKAFRATVQKASANEAN